MNWFRRLLGMKQHVSAQQEENTAMTIRIPQLGFSDAIIVVDVQNDFCPGGALPVEEGDKIVPVLNHWLDAVRHDVPVVVASCDWHPPNHVSFQERGGPWPRHCVQGTPGAAFHPDLHLPKDAWIIRKGTDPDEDQYSALDRTGVIERLQSQAVRRLWVGGLALDVCVRATVFDALGAGFEVHLIADATRAVNVRPDGGKQAIEQMQEAGAIIK
ncbi:MAG: nicotinamidase [Phycisphaeraceae bacterium]